MRKNVIQSRFRSKTAFTLIELLVVVLIIGVLAAVAVPQYKLTVEKSRATEGIVALRAIAQANDIYRLQNGTYSENLAELDIVLPGSVVVDGGIPSVDTQYFVCRAQGAGGDRQYYSVCRNRKLNYSLAYKRSTRRPECIPGTDSMIKYCKAITGKNQASYYVD